MNDEQLELTKEEKEKLKKVGCKIIGMKKKKKGIGYIFIKKGNLQKQFFSYENVAGKESVIDYLIIENKRK